MISIERMGIDPVAFVDRLTRRVESSLNGAVRAEAEYLREEIVRGIENQAPGGRPLLALAISTLATRSARGQASADVLFVEGDLLAGITAVHEPGESFVGVLNSAENRTGRSLVMIATVQEFGAVIVVRKTPEMIAFLAAAMRAEGLPPPPAGAPSSPVMIIRIPARPFLAPAVEAARPEAAKRFARNFTEGLVK